MAGATGSLRPRPRSTGGRATPDTARPHAHFSIKGRIDIVLDEKGGFSIMETGFGGEGETSHHQGRRAAGRSLAGVRLAPPQQDPSRAARDGPAHRPTRSRPWDTGRTSWPGASASARARPSPSSPPTSPRRSSRPLPAPPRMRRTARLQPAHLQLAQPGQPRDRLRRQGPRRPFRRRHRPDEPSGQRHAQCRHPPDEAGCPRRRGCARDRCSEDPRGELRWRIRRDPPPDRQRPSRHRPHLRSPRPRQRRGAARRLPRRDVGRRTSGRRSADPLRPYDATFGAEAFRSNPGRSRQADRDLHHLGSARPSPSTRSPATSGSGSRRSSVVGSTTLPFVGFLQPPLTTVRQPSDEFGRAGVRPSSPASPSRTGPPPARHPRQARLGSPDRRCASPGTHGPRRERRRLMTALSMSDTERGPARRSRRGVPAHRPFRNGRPHPHPCLRAPRRRAGQAADQPVRRPLPRGDPGQPRRRRPCPAASPAARRCRSTPPASSSTPPCTRRGPTRSV